MQLVEPKDHDLVALMTWFGDERATREWGGPLFQYPFGPESFREDAQFDALSSYCARDDTGKLIAFGQVYEKRGRGHLARLALAPGVRGKGLGFHLVNGLCNRATDLYRCSEHSLFVLHSNTSAMRCYDRVGFQAAPYPEDDGKESEMMFMVRAVQAGRGG